MVAPVFDSGSFRDPDGHVFFYENEIYRTLTTDAVHRMERLLKLSFVKKSIIEGRIIDTKILEATKIFPKDFLVTEYVLWHEKIPYVTYPFEWTFSMLKDAAYLMLDLLSGLLENNFILKDGTAWNICFYNGKPCFYDILSIDTYVEGQPWEGFSQFLQEFLYPLMIQSYQGIDFQPLWRSTLAGIPAKLCYKSLSRSSLFKKGVFKYVYLQEKLSSNKTISEATLKHEFTHNAFSKKALTNLIKNLRLCLETLTVKSDQSVWKNYDSKNSYEEQDVKEKEKFVVEGLKALNPLSVMDLGCNTGRYSLIAADIAPVISCDLDPTCVDQIYLKKNSKILPVVLNLMTPTSSMGWHLNERKDIFTRVKSDSFMALALMHHLCISHNVPLSHFILLLRSIASKGIVEWVDKSDPMVQFLLRNRKDIFKEYTWENFQHLIREHFHIEKTLPLNNGVRQIMLLSEKKN
ncbi:MAG: hypothetical protein JSR85_06240 [Proteobacteria bacterium]|nr:hypothetical protein [Pseudomonadota bacterium]